MNINGIGVNGVGYDDNANKPAGGLGANRAAYGSFGDMYREKIETAAGAAKEALDADTLAEINAINMLKGLGNDIRREAINLVQNKGLPADEAVFKAKTEKMTAVN